MNTEISYLKYMKQCTQNAYFSITNVPRLLSEQCLLLIGSQFEDRLLALLFVDDSPDISRESGCLRTLFLKWYK